VPFPALGYDGAIPLTCEDAMAEINPYKAPEAHVADVSSAAADNRGFNPEGRAVAAGNGWQWISRGWELFRQQPAIWIGIVVVFALLLIGLSFIPVLGSLANALLAPVLMGGVMIGCRTLAQGEPLELGHLFAGFRQNTGSLVMVGVFNLVAVAVIMIVLVMIIGGSVMGAMMGGGGKASAMAAGTIMLGFLVGAALYIPVYAAIWFAPALIALHDMPPVEALKRSFAGCLKNWVAFVIYGIIGLAVAVLASIPFMLGWLVAGPVFAASVYAGYRDIYFED
jgi:uncharacterized membrane protein